MILNVTLKPTHKNDNLFAGNRIPPSDLKMHPVPQTILGNLSQLYVDYKQNNVISLNIGSKINVEN